MRHFMHLILLGGVVFGQSMVEHAAAAAGGSVGGIAGKKVSDGLTTIFEKVDKQTAKAATKRDKTEIRTTEKESEAPPLLEVSPGVLKGTESVPPPPPKHTAAVHKPAPPAPKPAPEPEIVRAAPPPPPEVTASDLKRVNAGMNREDLLQIGAPASRITMFEDGHLLEVYRYTAKDTTFGVVRLSDGSVAAVEVR